MSDRIIVTVSKLECDNFGEYESICQKFIQLFPNREYSDYIMYDYERHENGNVTCYMRNHRKYKL